MTRKLVSALAALVLAATVGSCTRSLPVSPSTDEVVIQTYAVPEGIDAADLVSDLRRSLQRGEEALGSVSLYPGGSLAVTAPASVQAGVAGLIATIAQAAPSTREPAKMVTVHYWALIARPVSKEGGQVDGTLAHVTGLQPVLHEIMAAQGSLQFDLLEQLQLVAADSRAQARGRRMQVEQRVVSGNGQPTMADIQIQLGSERGGIAHSVQTRVVLDPGRFVVLAQSGYKDVDRALPQGWDPTETMLYYVVSADVD